MTKFRKLLSHRLPAVPLLLSLTVLCLLIGIPVFQSGALHKDSTEAEKRRWMIGSSLIEAAAVLAIVALLYFITEQISARRRRQVTDSQSRRWSAPTIRSLESNEV